LIHSQNFVGAAKFGSVALGVVVSNFVANFFSPCSTFLLLTQKKSSKRKGSNAAMKHPCFNAASRPSMGGLVSANRTVAKKIPKTFRENIFFPAAQSIMTYFTRTV